MSMCSVNQCEYTIFIIDSLFEGAMGKVIVFGSDKGGVGKTTTLINIAVMATQKGLSTIILKSDKNNDLFHWAEIRADNGLQQIPVYEAYGDISKEIQKLQKLCDLLFVDCAGHDCSEFRSALTVSNVALTLVKPSSMFEKTTLTTVTKTIRTAQIKHNPELQPYVLMTRVKPHKTQAATALDDELRGNEVWIQPLRTRISELDVFENAVNEGAGVHEVEKASSLSAAKAQLELIANEIDLFDLPI